MRDDYKIKGPTVKMEVQVEKEVQETLTKMEKFSKHSISELVNVALKNFIARHKDFTPSQSS
jgi:hypothetical protein